MARKETAFPLWRATDSRWKRNMVSLVSSVIIIIIIQKRNTRIVQEKTSEIPNGLKRERSLRHFDLL